MLSPVNNTPRNEMMAGRRVLLEQILGEVIDFLNAGINEGLREQHDSLVGAIVTSLQKLLPADQYLLPCEFAIAHQSGASIVFTFEESHHGVPGETAVAVYYRNSVVQAQVDGRVWRNFCTALLIRNRCAIPYRETPTRILTNKGSVYLKGADLRISALCNAHLAGANLENAQLQNANLRGCILVGANLKNANLKSVNMTGANLYGADLNSADLRNAIMTDAVLQWANLHRADLTHACLLRAQLQNTNLWDCKLQGANLANAVMVNAYLHAANLQNTNLKNADLRHAVMTKTYLHAANLKKANLEKADLKNAVMTEVCLAAANLKKANLNNAVMTYAYLPAANLQNATMEMATLLEADLQNTNLSNTNLAWANLENVNMQGSRLSGTLLFGTKLNNANLKDAQLVNVSLSGVDLTGVVLTNVGLTNWLPAAWNADAIESYLNHIRPPQHGSLLTMMDSIDAQYADIKIKMARELRDSLQDVDTSEVIASLLDILPNAPWNNTPDIALWLESVCQNYIHKYNTLVMPRNLSYVNWHLLTLFIRYPRFSQTFNSAFIQLIDQGMAEESEVSRNIVANIYRCYLNEESVSPWTALETFSNGSGKPDWTDPWIANYILISPAPDGQVMLLSQNTLQGMLRPDPLHPVWSHFYLYNSQRENLAPGQQSPETLFSHHFPLFSHPWKYAQGQVIFYKLLDLLNLEELYEVFISATRQSNSQTKLEEVEKQQRLREIFQPLLNYSTDSGCYSLQENHYCRILDVYDLTSTSDTARAKMLLCLATAFTKYSSNAIFGTEKESPEMLRFYAYALMEKAYQLDRAIFNSAMGDQFTDWKNRLLGLGRALSCSAVLSSIIVEHIRQHFPEALVGVLPLAWY